MNSIEDYLQLHAQQHPQVVALVQGDITLTYAELWQRVVERSQALQEETSDDRQQDSGKGRRLYIFRASQDADFLVTYLALHLSGYVAVPLEHDLPESRFEEIERQAQQASVGVPADVADVLLTTGTTGQAKGVMISHRTILADAENLVEAQGFHAGMTFIICGPLNHIGSLSKVYPTLMVGATLCILPGIKDMGAFFDAIETSCKKVCQESETQVVGQGRVATFLVPTSIHMLLQLCSDRLRSVADMIEFIETGAAPMPQTDMEKLCQVLPTTRLYNTYASTETGIIATYDYQHEGCQAGCLGRPMKHSSIQITADGNVACQGDTLMTGYLGDESLTQQVLRDDETSKGLLEVESSKVLYTNDQGYLDNEGRLHLTGRADDVINVGGYKVNPVEVEDVARTFPGLSDCICIPSPHPYMGSVLKLLVVLNGEYQLNKRQLALHLNQRLDCHKVPTLYEQVSDIRRTYNGKLDRKSYK